MLPRREPKHVNGSAPATNPTSPDSLSEIAREVQAAQPPAAVGFFGLVQERVQQSYHNMKTFAGRLGNFGEISPMNRLSGTNQNTSHNSRPTSTRPPSSPPAAKRQKVVAPNRHTQALFTLAPASEGPDNRQTSRKRSFDSHGSQHTINSQLLNAKGMQSSETNIHEYRNVEQLIKPAKSRSRKRPRLEITDDSDGEIEIIDPSSMVTSQKQDIQTDGIFITEMAGRFDDRKGRRGAHGTDHRSAAAKLEEIIDNHERKSRASKNGESSPDELALEKEDMPVRMLPKRIVPPSPSLSRKGDIPRTKFSTTSIPSSQNAKEEAEKTDLHRAMRIIGPRLRIVQAISGGYKYEADKASSMNECFLKLRETSTILHPTNLDGELLKDYAYCTVKLSKVKYIEYALDPDSRLALVDRSTEVATSSSRRLIIEFRSREELKQFIDWTQMEIKGMPPRNLSQVDRVKLEKNLSTYSAQANWSKTIRDDEQRGDDIKLIEHNEKIKSASRPNAQSAQSRTKNQMKLPHSISSQPRGEATIISNYDRLPNPAQQLRTTRSTFAPKESSVESDPPAPEGWTAQNKGWEKNWRNSLIFPPSGKSRAIVDKEDIPRLDEGEFLNDNLIIFYLRYLQHSLEADRPDLAQRIYFQNTFFYEKLKSSRTSQGINFESVKAWTSKVDLFTKDYIIVPINEFSHWYVAIIYNAPKLLPSPDTHSQDPITIEDTEESRKVSDQSPHAEKSAESTGAELAVPAVESDLINHLSPPSPGCQKENTDGQSSTPNREVEVVQDKDDSKLDAEQISSSASNHQKKGGKKQGALSRKFSSDQPRIITLDSLGIQHSPACGCLKQYLIAELKDKKGIEISNPGALGMTAKEIPEQTNYCDCGLYLLGYIQEFLKDPDRFVRSLLQRENQIPWKLDPSQLRNEIRDLVFKLQKEQQDREDAHRRKRSRSNSLKRKRPPAEEEPELVEQQAPPAEEPIISRSASKSPEKRTVPEEAKTMVMPKPRSPSPKNPISCPEESNQTPISLPSAIVERAHTKKLLVDVDNTKHSRTPKLLSPLPESTCGSSPTRPMIVEDSESFQKQIQELASDHGTHVNPQQAIPSTKITEDSSRFHVDQGTPIDKSQDAKAQPTISPYFDFAGRQVGDKQPSAKLHQEREIVDLSD